MNKSNAPPVRVFSPEQAIRIAADDIEYLRPLDVYRVLSTTPAVYRQEVADFIRGHHPLYPRMLAEVEYSMKELQPSQEEEP